MITAHQRRLALQLGVSIYIVSRVPLRRSFVSGVNRLENKKALRPLRLLKQ